MRFASTWVLWFLLLIPIFFIFWKKTSKQPTIRVPLPLPSSSGVSFSTSLISTVLKSLALAFFIIALARPQSISKTQDRKESGVDIVMLLDVSLSMLIQDMGAASRMDIAKQTFRTFIEGRNSDRIGFIIFSGNPLTLAPPTLDYGLLLAQLDTVEAGGPGLNDGTAIGDGLALAINRLKKSNHHPSHRW